MVKGLWLKLKKKIKNWIIYRFIKFLITFLNLFPRKISLFAGAILGKTAYYVIPQARKEAFNNLKLAFPRLKINTYRKICLKVFESIGRNSSDAVRLPKMNWKEIEKMVRTEGMERLEKAYAQGKGVIVITGHIGNFELLATYVSLRGYKVSVIGRELYDPRLNKLLVRSREKAGVHNIPTTANIKEVIKALNSGRILGILMDQDSSRVRGISVNFFGKPARTPVGAIILALKLYSPIVPMAIVQTREGDYKIIVREEIKPNAGKDKEENILYLTQKCTDFLEEVIRRHPDQWVWMHKRWRKLR